MVIAANAQIDIYPRLATTVTALPSKIGSHASFSYSIVNTLRHSVEDAQPAVSPLPPIEIIEGETHRHVSEALEHLAGYVLFNDNQNAANISSLMREVGEWIGDYLLKPICLCVCDRDTLPQTIEIFTNRHDIPWELTWTSDDFLSRKAIHARYPFIGRGRQSRPLLPTVPSMAIVVGRSLDLFSAEAEIDALVSLYDQIIGSNVAGAKIEVYRGEQVTVDLIRDLLRGVYGRFDILHYIGHGASNGNTVWLELVGSAFLNENIPPNVTASPLVFWNCCFSGKASAVRARYQADVVDGFGARLLSVGARHFIGPMFPVSDATAKTFAVEFYSLLLQRVPVGIAFYQAKLAASALDPIALTYVLYGNPCVKVMTDA